MKLFNDFLIKNGQFYVNGKRYFFEGAILNKETRHALARLCMIDYDAKYYKFTEQDLIDLELLMKIKNAN